MFRVPLPFVIPAKAGIQTFDGVLKKLDSGLTSSAVENRRNDELELFRVSLALVGGELWLGRALVGGELWLEAPEGAMLFPVTHQGTSRLKPLLWKIAAEAAPAEALLA